MIINCLIICDMEDFKETFTFLVTSIFIVGSIHKSLFLSIFTISFRLVVDNVKNRIYSLLERLHLSVEIVNMIVPRTRFLRITSFCDHMRGQEIQRVGNTWFT